MVERTEALDELFPQLSVGSFQTLSLPKFFIHYYSENFSLWHTNKNYQMARATFPILWICLSVCGMSMIEKGWEKFEVVKLLVMLLFTVLLCSSLFGQKTSL